MSPIGLAWVWYAYQQDLENFRRWLEWLFDQAEDRSKGAKP